MQRRPGVEDRAGGVVLGKFLGVGRGRGIRPMIIHHRHALKHRVEMQEHKLHLTRLQTHVPVPAPRVKRFPKGPQRPRNLLRDLPGAVDCTVGIDAPGREDPVWVRDEGFGGMVEGEAVEVDEVLVVEGGGGVDAVSWKSQVSDAVAPDAGIWVRGVGELVGGEGGVGGGIFEVSW